MATVGHAASRVDMPALGAEHGAAIPHRTGPPVRPQPRSVPFQDVQHAVNTALTVVRYHVESALLLIGPHPCSEDWRQVRLAIDAIGEATRQLEQWVDGAAASAPPNEPSGRHPGRKGNR